MTAAKCPICGKPTSPEHRPFCSARCANVDLHRWLAGRYVAPGASAGADPLDPDDNDEA